MDIWEYCVADEQQMELFTVLQSQHEALSSSEYNNETAEGAFVAPAAPNSRLISALNDAEEHCRHFIAELDGILTGVDAMTNAYGEVTARSNNLMSNCETLLEEQHSLQDLVYAINEALTPFNNVEDFAHVLGIPVDAYGHKSTRHKTTVSSATRTATASSDPRSSEFLKTMNHITACMKFIQARPDIKDAALYKKWLRYPRSTADNTHPVLTPL